MTKLPTESWQIKNRPDLPAYLLNKECAISGCSRIDVENHHIFRRSFQTKSYWVELEDGTVVANRVGICPTHHLLLTTNKASLVLQKNLNNQEVYFYQDEFLFDELNPHPPFFSVISHFVPQILKSKPEPGEKCETCERRVPYPKKESSPKTKVFGVRVPIDDVDTFHEILEAASEHIGTHTQPHWQYWTIQRGLILVLQETN